MGTFKPASDIDLVLFGSKVDFSLANQIQEDLEEDSFLPYFVDVIAYNSIDNAALKAHIDQYGVVLYEASTSKIKDSL